MCDKTALYEAIALYGLLHPKTIKLSQELDRVIVVKQKRIYEDYKSGSSNSK